MILFVMYGSSVFSSGLLSLKKVGWVCISLLDFGMVFGSFHWFGIVLLFSAII